MRWRRSVSETRVSEVSRVRSTNRSEAILLHAVDELQVLLRFHILLTRDSSRS